MGQIRYFSWDFFFSMDSTGARFSHKIRRNARPRRGIVHSYQQGRRRRRRRGLSIEDSRGSSEREEERNDEGDRALVEKYIE